MERGIIKKKNKKGGRVRYDLKSTVLSLMIGSDVVHVNEKIKYQRKMHSKEGKITKYGINCNCCGKIFTASKFQLHAGGKERHRPYKYIFKESGISLVQCQINAWEKQKESDRQSFCIVDVEGGDDTCHICADGGDLLCCDDCPSTFHQECLGIETLPQGDWHCRNCYCKFCGFSASSCKGRVTTSLLSCFQCEQTYHQVCIPESDFDFVWSDENDASFCGKSCEKVYMKLQEILGIKEELEGGFYWSIVCRLGGTFNALTQAREVECNSKVAIALEVMNERFYPMIDGRSGINMIHNVIYNRGSNINRLDYSGFYTCILEKDEEIVTVASIRIHGTKLAEIPFICTREEHAYKGMCTKLLKRIELILQKLKVEKLVMLATPKSEGLWKKKFGFKTPEASQLQEIRLINMFTFLDMRILEKPILESYVEETNSYCGEDSYT